MKSTSRERFQAVRLPESGGVMISSPDHGATGSGFVSRFSFKFFLKYSNNEYKEIISSSPVR